MHKKIAVYDNSISARTYLSYIAEQAGGFACIGRDGKLYIKTIGKDITELPLKYFQKFKWGEKFKISRVRYEDGIQLFEKGDTTDNTVYINQENMYIVEQEQLDNIYNQLNGLEVHSFEGDSIIDPSIDIGDILIIDGKKVIYQGSMQYTGKFKVNISSKIQSKSQEETTTRTPSQKVINRRVQSQIDQAEGKITLLATTTETAKTTADNASIAADEAKQAVEETKEELNASIEVRAEEVTTNVSTSVTSTIMTLLNNGYLTAEQVNALVNGNTEDIAVIKEQLKQTVTSSQMQIEISKAIEGGVSSLKNTLFTIDENGMVIATNQDEFNALYNNKGMYLYSYDQMIAKFDVRGATVNNLKVEGEIETNNLRIMDTIVDGVAHTHIHWIGG